jgi:hypothetical protein
MCMYWLIDQLKQRKRRWKYTNTEKLFVLIILSGAVDLRSSKISDKKSRRIMLKIERSGFLSESCTKKFIMRYCRCSSWLNVSSGFIKGFLIKTTTRENEQRGEQQHTEWKERERTDVHIYVYVPERRARPLYRGVLKRKMPISRVLLNRFW